MAAEAGALGEEGLRQRLLGPLGRFFFRYRDFVFPAVFFAIVLLFEPGPPGGPQWLDTLLDGIGIALALSGQLLRALVIGLAYIRRGGLNKQIHADSLVVEGFFAHSRNPLYLGNFLALVGFCFIHASLAAFVVAIPFFALAYLAIVTAEEQYLRQRFGPDFEEYCRRVPRFLPSLAGIRTTLASMRFDLRRLIRKEYGSTFAGVTVILLLLLWEEYRQHGTPAAVDRLPLLLALWLPLLIAYATARYLKKTGALGTG